MYIIVAAIEPIDRYIVIIRLLVHIYHICRNIKKSI